MGTTCSSSRSSDDNTSVDPDSTRTLTEDPTLLEMGFGAEVCRLYDFIQNGQSEESLRVTRKDVVALVPSAGTDKEKSHNKGAVAPNASSIHNNAKNRKTLLLKRVTSENPLFLLRWYHTMDVLSELNHPNLPRVIDIHDDDDNEDQQRNTSVSFVMEACEGGHLFERARWYNERNAKKIFRQVLEVVSYLHSQNIVHGDLRAEWFQFESTNPKNFHLKLTDFSLAQQLPEDEPQSTTTTTRPRVHHDHEPCLLHTSPQILTGSPHSKRGDMWSVGVILYRLLSGERPFGDTADELHLHMRVGPTLSFSQPVWKRVAVGPKAKDLIRKLLTVEPKDRLTAKQALKHGWFSSFPTNLRMR